MDTGWATCVVKMVVVFWSWRQLTNRPLVKQRLQQGYCITTSVVQTPDRLDIEQVSDEAYIYFIRPDSEPGIQGMF